MKTIKKLYIAYIKKLLISLFNITAFVGQNDGHFWVLFKNTDPRMRSKIRPETKQSRNPPFMFFFWVRDLLLGYWVPRGGSMRIDRIVFGHFFTFISEPWAFFLRYAISHIYEWPTDGRMFGFSGERFGDVYLGYGVDTKLTSNIKRDRLLALGQDLYGGAKGRKMDTRRWYFLTQLRVAKSKGGGYGFYDDTTRIDLWRLWVVHRKMNRIIFSYIRTFDARERKLRGKKFKFKVSRSKLSNKFAIYRYSLFKRNFKWYVVPRKAKFMSQFGRYRKRLHHKFGYRHMIVRKRGWTTKRMGGGHGIKQPKTVIGHYRLGGEFTKISPYFRSLLRKRRWRFFISPFLLAKGRWEGGNDSASLRHLLERGTDANKNVPLRFYYGRFNQRDWKKGRHIHTWMYSDWFPLNIGTTIWYFAYEHIYWYRNAQTFWFSYQWQNRIVDRLYQKSIFPWKTAWMRKRKYAWREDKSTDFVGSFRFYKYYDEIHYTFHGSTRQRKLKYLGMVGQSIKPRKKKILRIPKKKLNILINLICNYHIVWNMFTTHFIHVYNRVRPQSRWTSKKRWWKHMNRKRRFVMRKRKKRKLLHGWYSKATVQSRPNKRGLGSKRRTPFTFYMNKYAKVTKLLHWGQNHTMRPFLKERVRVYKYKRNLSVVRTRDGRTRGIKKRVFIRASWFKRSRLFTFRRFRTGTYHFSRRFSIYRKTKMRFLIRIVSAFHLKWNRQSIANRDTVRYGVKGGAARFLRKRLWTLSKFYTPLITFRIRKTFFLRRNVNTGSRFLGWRWRFCERKRPRTFFRYSRRRDYNVSYFKSFFEKQGFSDCLLKLNASRKMVYPHDLSFDDFLRPNWVTSTDGSTGIHLRMTYLHAAYIKRSWLVRKQTPPEAKAKKRYTLKIKHKFSTKKNRRRTAIRRATQ